MESSPLCIMLTQVGSIISVIVGAGMFLLHEIRLIGKRMDELSERTDRLIEAQTQRTDKLYEMFIDLLKEQKHGK